MLEARWEELRKRTFLLGTFMHAMAATTWVGDAVGKAACRLLVVGDGDFSFSEAFTQSRALDTTVTTSYDTAEELKRKYGASYVTEIVSKLVGRGVEVFHGVDATRLKETLPPSASGRPRIFERIVFNFPHQGGKSNIKQSRALLIDFFASASALLTETGEIVLTLAKGQGGTSFDVVQRQKGNSWQVVEAAACSSFILTRCGPWVPLEGYRSSGYRSSKRSFVTRDGITHIFCRDHLGNPSLCPPSWRHDVSVWVMDEDVFSADFLLAAIYDVVGSENVASFELLSTIVVTPRDSTISDRKTLSHCYKLVYQNNAGKAISKQHAWNMMMEVRESLEKRTNRVVIVR